MRIVQLLPTLAYGDAVGNDTLAIDTALKEAGYNTAIYAENIGNRVSKKKVKIISEYQEKSDDLVIFHLSIYSKMNELVKHLKCKVIIMYHNVTPSHFFAPYSREKYELCEQGIRGVADLCNVPIMCIADSEFNKQDLIRMGYKCPIEVVPILIAFDDYKMDPDKKIIKKYEDDEWTNILFTGRIAPNKKQEDVVKAFYYYKKYYNRKSRLLIVGAYDEKDLYYRKLKSYVEELGLPDVEFSGHISFAQILAYYHVADILLCMSEHEGFCVPLVEAMCFDLPVIAYDSCAVGETLGGSGVLLKEKNFENIAGIIDYLVNNDEVRKMIVRNEQNRLKDFSNAEILDKIIKIITKYV